MALTRKSMGFAWQAGALLLGLSIASHGWAEPRTIGIASIPYANFFKSVWPIITEVDPGMSVGQTFFATGTGTISEFEFSPGGVWEVSVHEGKGKDGTLLHSQRYDVRKTGEQAIVKFTKNIPVTGGKYYTVVLTNKMDRMLGIYATRNDAYMPGERFVYKSGYRAGEGDLYFQVRGDLTGDFVADIPLQILTGKPEVKELSLKPGESVGQSFLAPGTGTLEKLHLDVDGMFDVAFHAGEGTGGKKLDSQTLTFKNSVAALQRAVPVEASKQYTFVLTNRNTTPSTVGETQGNGYAYGRKLLKVDPSTIEYDIAFRLTGWTKKLIAAPAAHPVPTYDPYKAASGPLTLMNCEAGKIQVATFNANDGAMLAPFKTYGLDVGKSATLECKTPTCKLKVGGVKTEPMSGYHVLVRGTGRATHPAAMAAGCRLYAKYK